MSKNTIQYVEVDFGGINDTNCQLSAVFNTVFNTMQRTPIKAKDKTKAALKQHEKTIKNGKKTPIASVRENGTTRSIIGQNDRTKTALRINHVVACMHAAFQMAARTINHDFDMTETELMKTFLDNAFRYSGSNKRSFHVDLSTTTEHGKLTVTSGPKQDKASTPVEWLIPRQEKT